MKDISMIPIGYVFSDIAKPDDMPVAGKRATVKIRPELVPALHKIEEHSHLWVLCWFHQARTDKLRVPPKRVNPDLPEYGVFGIRTPTRPNPISLTLVGLEKVEGELLYVTGLDAVLGTPVLDIKPYFEQDIVFSPATPYIRPAKYEMRKEIFFKEALRHHQEECVWLHLGIKMALIAEEHFGRIQSVQLKLKVKGPGCLADVLQGLTRARLANPPRFSYDVNNNDIEVTWINGNSLLIIKPRRVFLLEEAREMSAQELFIAHYF